MKRNRDIVRIAINTETMSNDLSTFLECLRYAGVISLPKVHNFATETTIVEVLPPKGANPEVWARMNAERMTTFGLNAVVAPEWK